ncbi:MAG: hypothetical protein K1566_04635 [Candidatus Thiodiazotropha sp. (ex. Lucinisca nassula)]|nr:hypothetical protein [Candidatus Thiodiazotropha sp. (ex. Lucinisca nassula)]
MAQNRNRKEGSLGRKLYKLLHRQVPLGKTLDSERSSSFTGLVLLAAFCVLVVVSTYYLGMLEGVLFALVFSVVAILILMDSVDRTKKRSGFSIKGFHDDE